MRTITRTLAVLFALVVLALLVWGAQRRANPPQSSAPEEVPQIEAASVASPEDPILLPSTKAGDPSTGILGVLAAEAEARRAEPSTATPPAAAPASADPEVFLPSTKAMPPPEVFLPSTKAAAFEASDLQQAVKPAAKAPIKPVFFPLSKAGPMPVDVLIEGLPTQMEIEQVPQQAPAAPNGRKP